MSDDSEDMIVLKHTWKLASPSIQAEFLRLISIDVTPPESENVPFAAALRLWLRLSPADHEKLRQWFNAQSDANRPHAWSRLIAPMEVVNKE